MRRLLALAMLLAGCGDQNDGFFVARGGDLMIREPCDETGITARYQERENGRLVYDAECRNGKVVVLRDTHLGEH
jgi:hypothetical protein